MDDNDIKVTIYCLTYNHKDYIEAALEGFLMQKTNFKYNILVFDDASNDGTSDILKKYKEKYNNIMDVIIYPTNTYGKKERKAILDNIFKKYIKGQYVAWCEGDDAWTDPNKLQIQVDYLDKNKECMMVTHSYSIEDFSNDNKITPVVLSTYDRKLTLEEVIVQKSLKLATASLVMKKEIFIRDNFFPVCSVEDYPMQLNAVFNGYIYYINKNMSLYRYMHTGSWCKDVYADAYKKMEHNFDMIRFLWEYNDYTKHCFNHLIKQKILSYLNDNIFSNEKLSYEQYQNMNKEIEHNNQVNPQYIKMQLHIFKYIKNEYILSKKEKNYYLKFKHIVIMGHGRFARYIADTFNDNGIDFDGYIVTNIKNENMNTDIIWEIAEYPYKKDGTVVVIGISQLNGSDNIVSLLKENYFFNIDTPLWIEL